MLENRKMGKCAQCPFVLFPSSLACLVYLFGQFLSLCLCVCECVLFFLTLCCLWNVTFCVVVSLVSFLFVSFGTCNGAGGVCPSSPASVARSCDLATPRWLSIPSRERAGERGKERAISVFAPSPKLSRARIGSTVGQVQAALRWKRVSNYIPHSLPHLDLLPLPLPVHCLAMC